MDENRSRRHYPIREAHHHSSHHNQTHLYDNLHPFHHISRNITNHQQIHAFHHPPLEEFVARKRGLTPAEASRPKSVPAKVPVSNSNPKVVTQRMRDFHDRIVAGHATKYRDPATTFANSSKTYVKYQD